MPKEILYLDNIEVYIEDSYEEMSRRAADIFVDELTENPNGVFGFATGSTPLGLYKELIRRFNNGEIDFSSIATFNLDEYYPIKKDNPQSYDYFMRTNLFNHINVNPDYIYIPNGEAPNAFKECLNYEKLISTEDGIELQILGIGENGHVGFNEPNKYFKSYTNYVALSDSTINANARFFDSLEDVPTHAITMGIKTIMQARKILLLANSSKKSEILLKALMGYITPMVPASILQLHPDVTVVTDKEAGQALVKKYND